MCHRLSCSCHCEGIMSASSSRQMTCSFVISGPAYPVMQCHILQHLQCVLILSLCCWQKLESSGIWRCVGGACCVHILGSHVEHTTLNTEAATCSKTSVTKYQFAKLYIPEDFVMHFAPCHSSGLLLSTNCCLTGYCAVHTELLNASYRYRRWIQHLQRLETKT